MLGQNGVEGFRYDRGNGGSSTAGHVDVRADEFRRGGDAAVFFDHHKMHEMPPFFGAADQPAMNPHRLADPHLSQIPQMAFQRKRPGIGANAIVIRQPEQVKHLAGGIAEQMRIPHHIHMAHLVEVVLGNGFVAGDGERLEVFWGDHGLCVSVVSKLFCFARSLTEKAVGIVGVSVILTGGSIDRQAPLDVLIRFSDVGLTAS